MGTRTFYSARTTVLSDCPCPCCSTLKECKSVYPTICQRRLNDYMNRELSQQTKYHETKKSKAIREKLEDDFKDIEKLILQLSKDGCKNDNNELVFLTSRYSYIKELLEKYWKDGEK